MRETRSHFAHRPELRSAPDGSKTLAGYAAVFNVLSQDLGGFVERVAPGAFNKTLQERDVVATLNHDMSRLLGRASADTLRLSTDETGLAYEVDLDAEDPDAISVARKLARGDLQGSSFTFGTVSDTWGETEQAYPVRTLHEVKLYELGPVTEPAYLDTTAAVRSLTRGETDHLSPAEIAARVAAASTDDETPEPPSTSPLVAYRLALLRRRHP